MVYKIFSGSVVGNQVVDDLKMDVLLLFLYSVLRKFMIWFDVIFFFLDTVIQRKGFDLR